MEVRFRVFVLLNLVVIEVVSQLLKNLMLFDLTDQSRAHNSFLSASLLVSPLEILDILKHITDLMDLITVYAYVPEFQFSLPIDLWVNCF